MSENEEQPQFDIGGFLQAGMRAHQVRSVANQFMISLQSCMEQEAVNLEAAILMGYDILEVEGQIEGKDPMLHELVMEGYEVAIREARSALSNAYNLVSLDRRGSRKPRPYDAKSHFESRARSIERVAFLRGIYGDQS